MATTVINIKSGQPYDVYIGRAMPRRGLPASPFANPYKISAQVTRDEAIRRYRIYLDLNPSLKDAARRLQGKVLACWCKPAACHGDILAALADEA